MSDEKPLTFLKHMGQQFAARKLRARERLGTYPRDEWNFALVGLERNTPSASVAGLAEFRRVIEPPGEIELSAALENNTLFGAIGRYSDEIRHELAVGRTFAGDDYQAVWNFAWWLISCIRVRTLVEFLVPVVANCSWSIVAAIDDHTCKAQLLEDVPQVRRLSAPVLLKDEDFQWAFQNALTMGNLLEVPRFRLAVEALTTHQQQLGPRMMAASIWSGIEALIGISNELRFRLAFSAASLLEPRGAKRYERYCQVKKLYDVRSTAVHGGELSEKAILKHVVDSRKLLSELICHMIDIKKALSVEEIERNMLD